MTFTNSQSLGGIFQFLTYTQHYYYFVQHLKTQKMLLLPLLVIPLFAVLLLSASPLLTSLE